MSAIPPPGIDSDIHRLEVGLRQLKVQYDMFFAGALATQPLELRGELERLIRRSSRKPAGRYAQQFHFNALVSRFHSLSELWNKQTRSREEGDRRSAGLLDRFEIRERLLSRCAFRDVKSADAGLRRLHDRFSRAAAERGGKKGPSFEQFVRGVTAQTQRLRKETGCDQIELRLVVRDDQVQVKARPGR